MENSYVGTYKKVKRFPDFGMVRANYEIVDQIVYIESIHKKSGLYVFNFNGKEWKLPKRHLGMVEV